MTASDGYIKIFRSIDKYGKDPVRLKAWLYLIIDAKWNGSEVGKVITTWTKLATRWELFVETKKGKVPDVNKTRRILKEMELDNRVKIEWKSDGSKVEVKRKSDLSIFLLNYANLQGKKQDDGSRMEVEWKSDGSFDENEPLLVRTSGPLIIKKKNKKDTIRQVVRTVKNVPISNSVHVISDVATSPHESPNEFRRVTDHIWNSYEKKYGVKPDSLSNKPLFKILRPLVEEWGEDVSKKAWDVWLKSEEQIPVECNHSPKTFSSTFWFNQCRVEATKVEVSTRRVWVEGPMILGD